MVRQCEAWTQRWSERQSRGEWLNGLVAFLWVASFLPWPQGVTGAVDGDGGGETKWFSVWEIFRTGA